MTPEKATESLSPESLPPTRTLPSLQSSGSAPTETAKAPLEKNLVEIIALSIASRKRNAYELHQHERLSIRLGFGREWVAEVERNHPEEAALLTDTEKLVQRFVLAAIDERTVAAQDLFSQVTEQFGYQQSIAILMVIGRYAAHAVMVASLGIAPPVPSIFEDGFGLDSSASP